MFQRLALTVLALLLPTLAHAGGAWVPNPGDGTLNLGYSRKHAASSWDAFGERFDNSSQHDFRYAYLSGDVGIMRNLSGQFLLTWLDGFEGPPDELERNTGFSDSWFGLKYQVARGRVPMSIGASLRTPMLYDREGPYNRYVFDSTGRRAGLSDEWRGLLKYDYTIAYLASHSFALEGSWVNFAIGYTWRSGAPADQIPVSIDGGYPLPWLGAAVKAEALFVRRRQRFTPPTERPFRHEPDVQLQPREHGARRAGTDRALRTRPTLERRGRIQQVALGPLGPSLPGALLLHRPLVLTKRE